MPGGRARSTSQSFWAKAKMSWMLRPSNWGTSMTFTSSQGMMVLVPMARSLRCQMVTVS